jgi:phosphoribosyl 1,2-cyclic phosphodiesterase
MHALYTKPYFQQYLKLSISIFERKYTKGTSYTNHESWKEFLRLLTSAGVSKILTYEEMYVRDTTKYGHAPITENSPSEEHVRQKHQIYEEIVL